MFVNLPKLVKLEIISWDSGWLLGYFSAPALESITIPLKGPIEIEAFLAFLTRSNVALKRLSIIDHIPWEEELLLKLLDALPHLTHLELDELRLVQSGSHHAHWKPSRMFFDYFRTPSMMSAGSGLPLPQLTTFKYRGHFRNSDIVVDALEKMLLARWNTNLFAGASRLQVFSMSIINSPQSVAGLERSPVVKELRNEGMHLAFKSVKQRMPMRVSAFRSGG